MQAVTENSSDENNSLKTKKKRIFDKGVVIIILLVTILVLLAGGAGFYAGNIYGQRKGTQAAVNKVTDLLNPLNAISSNAAFPYTVIGKVTKVSAKEVTVKLPNGEEKTVATTEKTKVTQGSDVKSLNDIKKDNNITIFTNGNGDDQVATRVVIR